MKRFIALCFIIIIVFISSCRKHEFEITDFPRSASFKRNALDALPVLQESRVLGAVADLRSYDLSALDGKNLDIAVLFRADFDTSTVWPDNLPQAFRPESILTIGKNPGLGIRSLHKAGNKGKNISIGIIGKPFLPGHREYGDRVRFYEEINIRSSYAQLLGSAVVSLVAGAECGTAPEADIFYIAQSGREINNGTVIQNLNNLALAVERILEINEILKRQEKIQVLLIVEEWSPDQPGYAELLVAIEKARKAGIFIISPQLQKMYGYSLQGLGREVYDNPNLASSYRQALSWSENFISNLGTDQKRLFVPSDARSAAGTADRNEYIFYRAGSSSFALSWLTGLYALCLESYPKLDAELFLQTAQNTAEYGTIKLYARKYPLAGIVSPEALIAELLEKRYK